MENPSDSPSAPPASSGCGWPAALVVVAIVALGAFIFYFTVHAPGSLARDLADSAAKLANLFGTDVRVDNQSVTLESKQILELATIQHRVVCVTKYETTWAGSTATIIVRGVYTAKAGFDLEKGTSFRLDEQGHVLDATIPPAKILSIATDEQKVFYDAPGVLKILAAKDYEEAFRQNRQQADREAVQMGMLKEARDRLKERLADMLPRRDGPLKLEASKE